MDLHAEQRYPATPDEVAAMLADEEFVRRWCDATGAVDTTVSVEGDPTRAFTVTTTRAFPTDRFPAFARGMLGSALQVTQTDEWTKASDGTWSASSEASTGGVPARLTARAALVAEGDLTRQVVEGEVTASMAFVAGKAESLMHDQVQRALAVQERVGREWLMS